jgi:hypothetical protein
MITIPDSNWLGLEPHATDEFLHWKDNAKKAVKLRAAYDFLVTQHGGPEKQVIDALRVLTDAAADAEGMAQAELMAGESI